MSGTTYFFSTPSGWTGVSVGNKLSASIDFNDSIYGNGKIYKFTVSSLVDATTIRATRDSGSTTPIGFTGPVNVLTSSGSFSNYNAALWWRDLSYDFIASLLNSGSAWYTMNQWWWNNSIFGGGPLYTSLQASGAKVVAYVS